jgi:hypothetical protein
MAENISKYPKTQHLPFSPCVFDDDVQLDLNTAASLFIGKEVVITEKLDGGNCQLYRGGVYARSVKSEANHGSFSAVKQTYAQFKFLVPDNLALFGENMFGIHSIVYHELQSYFYLFAVLEDGKEWWSWDQVTDYAKNTLGVPHVPELFRGTFDSLKEMETWMNDRMLKKDSVVGGESGPEGFVVRLTSRFSTHDFEKSVAKYVRKNHIQTEKDWLRTWKAAKLNK